MTPDMFAFLKEIQRSPDHKATDARMMRFPLIARRGRLQCAEDGLVRFTGVYWRLTEKGREALNAVSP